MKKLLVLLFALLILFCSCDISEIEELDETVSENANTLKADTSVFGVGFASGESADPYTTKSKLNAELMGLICEPLFSVSENFEVTPVLCADYSCSDRTYSFNIKRGVLFSDGSELLASDVEYSLKAAMEQGSYYASTLSVIESISSSDRDGTVRVSLKYDNAHFPALLDLPIIKSGTRNNMFPTGTGLYKPKDDLSALVAREDHHGNKKPRFSVISLKDIGRDDELLFEFDNHTVSVLTVDPTGTAPLTPISASQITNIPTTRMHYLGFNMRKIQLSDKAFRLSVARAVDRESIARDDFTLMGKAAALPVHPSASSYPDKTAKTLAYNRDLAVESTKTLTLLVNSENAGKLAACKRIAETLTRFGTPCTVRALPFNEYASALSGGDFDLYYAEVALGADFDLTRLLQGSLNYGGFYDPELSSLHSAYLAGDEAKGDFFEAFCDKLPFVPIMFKDTAMYAQNGYLQNAFPTQQNTYSAFVDWVFGSEE